MSAQPKTRSTPKRASRSRQPQSKSRGRGHLRLVSARPGRSQAAKTGPGVPFLATTFLVVAIGIFGLVLLHIYAAQSSFHLRELQEQASEQEARFRDMRLEVAAAESPKKVAEAASSLGLVVPEAQEYIVGPPGKMQVAESEPSLTDKNLKALLGRR